MADILLTSLSDALMAVAKTTPLKANTKAQADKTAQALIQALPGRNFMRAGLIIKSVEDAVVQRDPEKGADQPWFLESEINGELFSGDGETLGTAARALLTDIEAG